MIAKVAVIAVAVIAAILGSPAIADSNYLNIVQDGDTHNGLVIQSGLGNAAGTPDLPVHQEGVFDRLSLTQSGDDNAIGTAGQGLVQDGTGSTDGSPANSATIVQNSDGNSIGELVQLTLGTHPTTGNTLAVTQDYGAGGGASGHNTIGSIEQVQGNAASPNVATVTQTGFENWIEGLDQRTSSGEGGNRVTLAFTGNYNGIDTGTKAGPGALGPLARSVGATASSIIQGSDLSGGAENTAELTVTGDYNQFGLTQLGADNSASESITGSDNSFAATQSGRHNQIVSGGIAGDSNDLGIAQAGDSNSASAVLNWSSSDNEVGLGQNGDGNTAGLSMKGDHGLVGLSQSGKGNAAGITTIGDRDLVLAIQVNDGLTASVGNRLDVAITGSGINDPEGDRAASFSGAALLAAAAAPLLPRSLVIAPDASLLVSSLTGGLKLVPGMLVQWGGGNSMSITVGATLPAADDLFAVLQRGNGNVLTASVAGNGNQFVAIQQGDGNTAGLTQDGTGNTAVILQ